MICYIVYAPTPPLGGDMLTYVVRTGYRRTLCRRRRKKRQQFTLRLGEIEFRPNLVAFYRRWLRALAIVRLHYSKIAYAFFSDLVSPQCFCSSITISAADSLNIPFDRSRRDLSIDTLTLYIATILWEIMRWKIPLPPISLMLL